MNILVFSDSHGNAFNMIEAFKKHIKIPDAVIFLGDGIRDISYCDFKGSTLFSVKGNCDCFSFGGMEDTEEEILITLSGKRIMMTHGHKYGVKETLSRLALAAQEKSADIVLFGHTHNPEEIYLPRGDTRFGFEVKKDMYFMNPGSIGTYCASFGSIEFDKSGAVILSHGSL